MKNQKAPFLPIVFSKLGNERTTVKAHKRLNDELIGPKTERNRNGNNSPIIMKGTLANPHEKKAKKTIKETSGSQPRRLVASASPHLIFVMEKCAHGGQ